MSYSAETIQQVEADFPHVTSAVRQARKLAIIEAERLHIGEAKRFLTQGVARRLEIMERCIRNIFAIFPVARTARLAADDVVDVNINLHAFVINCWGVHENLAWVYQFENGLKTSKWQVSLFKPEFQAQLPLEIQQALTDDSIQNWINEYARDYRDVLAHRVPFFVPPALYFAEDVEQDKQLAEMLSEAVLTGDADLIESINMQRDGLGTSAPHFFNLDSAHATQVAQQLHPQVLADAKNTVLLLRLFAKRAFKATG